MSLKIYLYISHIWYDYISFAIIGRYFTLFIFSASFNISLEKYKNNNKFWYIKAMKKFSNVYTRRDFSSLSPQRNERKGVYFNSPYDLAYPGDPPLISSSLLMAPRRLLMARSLRARVTLWKRLQRQTARPAAYVTYRYVHRKCILVRDAHRAIPPWATGANVRLLFHTCSATQIRWTRYSLAISLIPKIEIESQLPIILILFHISYLDLASVKCLLKYKY